MSSRPVSVARPRASRTTSSVRWVLRDHVVAQLATDHHLDERIGVGLGRRHRPDRAAVTQDRDALGDGEDLLELVRDVDDGDALISQAADDPEEPLDLAIAERRRRLVHQQQADASASQGAGDLDDLSLRDAERPRLKVEVEIHSQPRERAARLLTLSATSDPPQALRLATQDEVLLDGQVADGVELLVDDADAEPLADREGHLAELAALPAHDAAVARVGPGQDLDEGGLAGSVLAEQGVDLPGPHREACALERLHAPEGLVDALELEQRDRFALRHRRAIMRSPSKSSRFACAGGGGRPGLRDAAWHPGRRRAPGWSPGPRSARTTGPPGG